METPRPGRKIGSLIIAVLISMAAVAATPPTAQAVTCAPDGTPPTSRDAGTVRLADDFETGDLRRWSRVVREGDAAIRVQNSRSHDGRCALRLTVTTRSDSRANARKYLATDTRTVRTSGWFRVDREGVSGINVPILRYFNGSSRMVDVHRKNGSGELWIRTANGSGGWNYARLGRTLPLGRWIHVRFRATAAWGSSVVTVTLDGTTVYANPVHRIPSSRLNMVMVGAEHVKQQMDLYVDEIVIKTGS